jgi:hypothetical protein
MFNLKKYEDEEERIKLFNEKVQQYLFHIYILYYSTLIHLKNGEAQIFFFVKKN